MPHAATPDTRTQRRNPVRRLAQTPWPMTLILLVGAALRLWDLTGLGLAHDEVANWLIDRSILDGNHAVYFTDAYGHEAGFHYVQTLFVALLGDNALALRLPAALAGVLLIAVTFALLRQIFGRNIALIAAALLAVTFFPVFYSRLGLRAISLPILSALSFHFFWQGAFKGGRRKAKSERRFILHPSSFALSGIFAGLSLYTYMAARTVPIFYLVWIGYLLLLQRSVFRQHWRGIALFALIYAVLALPLVLFLQTTPNGEFRISEIDAPLRALLAGDPLPALRNSIRIAGAFGVRGDPLWRQNVADAPIFVLLAAILFYGGVLIALWRRRARHVFALLWATTAVIPSIVTVDAPSTIRMVNILPVLTLYPALSIHSLRRLSTRYPQLSTTFWRNSWITLLTIVLIWTSVRTVSGIFWVWPNNEEVQFVWQRALTDAARALDASAETGPVAIMGWSPDTMDPHTITLALLRDDLTLRHFGGIKPEPVDTLILPGGNHATRVVRPAILPLDPDLEAWLAERGTRRDGEHIVWYDVAPEPGQLEPETPVSNGTFGDEITLLGVSAESCMPDERCTATTVWRVEQPSTGPRSVFLHVLDSDGTVLAQDDGLDVPAAEWRPGDIIVKRHEIPFSAETQPAHMVIGVYNPQTGIRLPLVGGGDALTIWGNDASAP